MTHQVGTSGRGRLRCAAVWAVLGLTAAGCQGRPEGYERFVPGPAEARKAVAAALDAWVAGRPTDAAVATRPDVYVVDKHRRPGQRLARYEILGEVTNDKARDFAVRLTLEGPDDRPVVRFLVVGREPLWVFRREDYEMISHWMHPMDAPGEPKPDPEPEP